MLGEVWQLGDGAVGVVIVEVSAGVYGDVTDDPRCGREVPFGGGDGVGDAFTDGLV